MLSKNNWQEQFRKQEPKRQRFAIKKLTVGVASVLIGFTFMGLNASASADENTGAQQQPEVSQPNGDANNTQALQKPASNDSTNGQKQDQTEQKPSASDEYANKVSAAVNAKLNQQQPSSEAKAEKANTPQQSPASDSNANSETVNFKPGTSDVLNSVSKVNAGNFADQLNASFVAMPESDSIPVENQQTVSDWKSFVNALSDATVSTINLNHDIDVTGGIKGLTGGQAAGYRGDLTLTGKGIARTVTINGNKQYSINFNDYGLGFQNENQKDSAEGGWNITFKDVTITGNKLKTHLNDSNYSNLDNSSYAPFNFVDVSADNQAKDTVTFDGVTANVEDRPIITGHKNNSAGSANINGEKYTLILKGTNNLTNKAYTGGATPGDDGNAISAGYITVDDGTTTINMLQTSSYNLQYGGAAVRTGQPDVATKDGQVSKYSVNIANGATLDIIGGKDVKGIVTANAITGTVNVDGNLQMTMGTGHSIAMLAGNLNVGKTGNVDITTAQTGSDSDKSITNLNSGQYGVLSIGVGYPANLHNVDANTINDNGSIKVVRTATAKSMSPIISMGSGASGLLEGNFTVNVNEGATLDLQDSEDQTNLGMIYVSGSSVASHVNFTNPGYINLQRKNALPKNGSDLIYLEGQPNGVTITQSPIAQWDAANMNETPSFTWIVKNVSSMNNWGDNAGSGFTAAGQTSPQNKKGDTKFLHSNGTVIMADNQAGLNSFQYLGNQTTSKDSPQGIVTQGTANGGSEYYTPYLNQFLNNFNYWTPQRLAMGSKLLDNKDVVTDADKYQPESQTITGTTKQKLSDLNPATGIKDYLQSDGKNTTTVDPATVGAKVTWYDATNDAAAWNKQMLNQDGNSMAQPSNPTGNLKTTDKSAWAKVAYQDGSVDFVNIPLNITEQDKDIYQPSYDPMNVKQGNKKTEKPSYPESKQGDSVTINPGSKAPEGTKYNIKDQDKTPFATVDPKTGALTVAPTKDNSKTGLQTVPVVVTYPDTTTDTVNVPVYIGDATHTGTITTDPKDPSKVTGAYEVVTAPSNIKAHETSDNSMNLKAGDAVSAINHYTINEDGTVAAPTSVDESTATITWKTAPSTVVTTPSASTDVKGTVSVSVVTGKDKDGKDITTTIDSNELTIPAAGAIAKDVTTPVQVTEGAALTEAQAKELVDTSKLDTAKISYTPSWVTAPKVGDKTATVRLTFTDNDAQGNPTYLDIPVKEGSINVVPATTDADKYQPEYNSVSVTPGETKTVTPTWQDDKKPADGDATFAKTDKTPTWATVANDGTVTLKPGTDVTPGHYNIPVQVTYSKDNSSETVYVPVSVNKTDPNKGEDTYYGDDSMTRYEAPVVSYHKTSADYTPSAAASGFNKITFFSGWDGKGYNDSDYKSQKVYNLSADGKTFVNAADPTDTFAASGITYTWQTGLDGVSAPNTNVSNFENGAADTTYSFPDNINKDEQTTQGQNLPGNSKWRFNYTVNADAASKIGVSANSGSWTNAYFNFYGASAKDGLTAKVNSDVPTDSATLEGYVNTDSLTNNANSLVNGKLTGATWATKPGNKDGKFVKGANNGTVRLVFGNDAKNYLDIPVVINVGTKTIEPTNPNDPNQKDLFMSVTRVVKVDGQKSDNLTQTLNYARTKEVDDQDASKVVSYGAWKLGNLEDGKWVASTDKAEFDSETAPSKDGYKTLVDGKETTKIPAETVSNKNVKESTGQEIATPQDGATVNVTYQKSETPVEDATVSYQFYDTTDKKNVGDPTKVTGKVGSTEKINLTVPKGYKLAEGETLPTEVTIPAKDSSVIINLVHETKDITPTDPSVDPTNDKYKDMFAKATRTIKYTVPAGHAAIADQTQTVNFGRNGVEDLVTGKITGTGDWKAGIIEGNKFVEKGNGEFAAQPVEQINDYTSLVDGKAAKEAPAAPALENGQPVKNAVVNVTYKYAATSYDPSNKDMNQDVTRTITVYNVDGTNTPVLQTVHFVRGGEGQTAIHADGTPVEWTVATKDGDTWKSTGATKGTWAQYDVPQVKGYTSTVDGKAATNVPANNDVTTDTKNADVTVAYTKSTQPTDPSINPNNPGENSDMFAHRTRTINVANPLTGKTDTTVQSVWFGRTKTVSTDSKVGTTYGDWQLGKVENDVFVIDAKAPNSWAEFDAPVFDGYTPSQAKVEAVNGVTPTTRDATVNITYNETDAHKYTADGGNITVNKGHVLDNTDAQNAIVNNDKLPQGTKYSWKDAPSTDTIGDKNGIVTVTYPDGSVDNVPVMVHVTDQAAQYDPEGQVITIKKGAKVPDAKDGIKNTGDLPSGTTYTWEVAPDPSKVGQQPVIITVTYPDGSQDQVPTTVIVTDDTTTPATKNDADKYTPEGQVVTVNKGDKLPDAVNGIKNSKDLPSGTTYTWKTNVDTNTPGDKPAVITVTYPDKSTEDVPTIVHVNPSDADKYAPQGQNITVNKGDKVPDPATAITNRGDLPQGTKYTWETTPDTNKVGDQPATVVVTYPDGSRDNVPVIITVKDPNAQQNTDADKYTPEGGTITAKLNEDLSGKAGDAIVNKGELPSGTKYAWTDGTPSTKTAGLTMHYVTVTYPDGTSEIVPTYVNVTSDADQYSPEPQTVTVKKGQQPDPEQGIKNKGDLPKGTKYTWKTPVDTTTPGDKPATVVVTYPDGSKEEVPTVVQVYTPAEGQNVNTTKGNVPDPEQGIKNRDDLPTGTTVDWTNPDKVKTDVNTLGNHDEQITVTYPDGTKDTITVTVNVHNPANPGNTDADKNTPIAQPITTPEGVVPDPSTGIKNKDDMPAGTKYTWKDEGQVTNDVKKPGSHTETIVVTYPDGSTDEVQVTVTVPVPQGQNINTNQGVLPNPADAIKNKDQMPDGTKYTWKVQPDVTTPGDHTGVVEVVFPDGTTYDVEVTVHVNAVNNTKSENNGTATPQANNSTVTNNSVSAPASVKNNSQTTTTNNSKQLPQTGNETNETASLIGLGLASIASLFGLGGLRKKNEEK